MGGDDRNLKEGYFSIVTTDNNQVKKFRVAPSYLAHPSFVKLLEAAEHEYGFDQPGVSSYLVQQMSSK